MSVKVGHEFQYAGCWHRIVQIEGDRARVERYEDPDDPGEVHTFHVWHLKAIPVAEEADRRYRAWCAKMTAKLVAEDRHA